MTASSKAFGSARPRRPHLALPGKGGVLGEVGILRQQVEEGFLDIEARSSSPEVDWIDGGAIQDTGGDVVFKGRNMIQGQTFANLSLFTGTSELHFYSLKPGTPGNDYTIAIKSGALGVTKVGNVIEVTVNIGVSTANVIATEFNKNGGPCDGYLACTSGGVGVAQVVTAATHLAGGEGEGFECRVGGQECRPANTPGTAAVMTLTETACTVTVPDLTGVADPLAAGDIVAAVIKSDGVFSLPVSSVLI